MVRRLLCHPELGTVVVPDADISAHVDGVEGAHRGPGGKGPHRPRPTPKTDRCQNLLSQGPPVIVEIAADNDRGPLMKADEGVAVEEPAKLALTLPLEETEVKVEKMDRSRPLSDRDTAAGVKDAPSLAPRHGEINISCVTERKPADGEKTGVLPASP